MHLRRFGAISALVVVLVGLLGSPAQAATSPIEQRYDSDAALQLALGPPRAEEFSVASGLGRHYEWGTLYWSPATGVREVHGAIRHRYQLMGGPTSELGFPTSDEGRVYIKYDEPEQAVGARSDFENGAVVWTAATNRTAWMSSVFADALPYFTFPYYGLPTADERELEDGARVLELGSDRMYSTEKGVFHLHEGYPYGSNGVVRKYLELGGETGLLGLPISDEYDPMAEEGRDATGRARNFEHGRIYQCGFWIGDCATDQAYEVHGAILWRFKIEGGVAGLGYPTSDETDAPGGRVSTFERGQIHWNRKTNETTVTYS